jgi:predicted dehydrogenase
MVEATPIRWGILATGRIATEFNEDLRLLPDAEVVAVASRSDDAARVFAEAHGIPRAYGSWQALADHPGVDVVYVATPHSAHYEATKLCLEAGKPVLCEKPFTLDLATAQDLVSTARANNVFLMEAMWTRTNPCIREVLALVADGEIGEITAVDADFGIVGPFPPSHRLRARELGGGALLDLGVYPITIAHLFLGVPETILAWASRGPEGTDENTGLVLGYASGGVATLHCGIIGETGQRATITGTLGRVELPRHFYKPDAYTVVRGDDVQETQIQMRGHGMVYEAEEVMRCIRQGELESPLMPHATTLEVMGILDEARSQIGVVYDADQ